MVSPAVNFHINKACDAACRFCFATFADVPGQLPIRDALAVVDLLRQAGVEKINFAGGEPTLHPHIATLVTHSRREGFTTSIVTNGSRLGRLLDTCADALDWVGFSVDTADEATAIAIGRSRGAQVQRAIDLAKRSRDVGVRVKLNTVVCALNVDQDLSPLVRAVSPERWKVFQALPMVGQNDGRIDELLISAEAFERFLARHEHLADEGFGAVAEDNDAMRGSYLMVDPSGRFFGNATGTHVYSAPIIEVGVHAAAAQVGFDTAKFERRGGRYAW